MSADPPATGVVNAAIDLFSVAVPLHAPKVQESTVEEIATYLSSHTLQRNPGRRAAMAVNVAVALYHALKVAVKETDFDAGSISNATDKILQELLQVWSMPTPPSVFLTNLRRDSLWTPMLLFVQSAWRHLDASATSLGMP